MISEESRDTKDLNNDAEIDTNTYLNKKVNLKCNISQYCICDQIDAALEVLKNTAGGQSLKVNVTLFLYSKSMWSTITNLGVKIDSNLKLDSQIRAVVKSSFFQLRQLAKIKPYLSSQHFETVIHAFVTTRLDYCNALYVGVSGSSIARLQMVQNAAARLLTGTRKYEHISPILASLHWLPVHFRIKFKILLFVFKSLNGLAPPYISELLHPYMPTHSLRSADQLLLNVPKTKRKLRGDRAFAVAAPKLWNDLPLPIRQVSSLSLFKSTLKTYLFSLAFDIWCWHSTLTVLLFF